MGRYKPPPKRLIVGDCLLPPFTWGKVNQGDSHPIFPPMRPSSLRAMTHLFGTMAPNESSPLRPQHSALPRHSAKPLRRSRAHSAPPGATPRSHSERSRALALRPREATPRSRAHSAPPAPLREATPRLLAPLREATPRSRATPRSHSERSRAPSALPRSRAPTPLPTASQTTESRPQPASHPSEPSPEKAKD